MAKTRKKGQQQQKKQPPQNEPWIPKRTGNIIIAVLSIGFAIWFTYQLTPALGIGEALLWGLGSILALWVIFFGMQILQRWLRGR